MPVQRKIFRVEELFSNGDDPDLSAFDPGYERLHNEVMTELRALRSAMSSAPQTQPQSSPDLAAEAFKAQAEAFQAHIAEARKFKIELDVIDQAIKKTKSEIVSLQDHGLDGGQIARVNQELNAVVNGTTEATDRILKAAETIEQTAGMLGAALKSEHEQGLAQDIQDQVTQIFEACNFHDLTSQRISKVLGTLNQVGSTSRR
ncbi:MAG: chemotaxis protein [Pseudorhodoplanes sp.]|nr:chemotaxis protein [Pseudorhodoplanes sp.]